MALFDVLFRELISTMSQTETRARSMGGQVTTAFNQANTAARNATSGTTALAQSMQNLGQAGLVTSRNIDTNADKLSGWWKKFGVATGMLGAGLREVKKHTLDWNDAVRRTIPGTTALTGALNDFTKSLVTDVRKIKDLAAFGGWEKAQAAAIDRAIQSSVIARGGKIGDSQRRSVGEHTTAAARFSGIGEGEASQLASLLLGNLRQTAEETNAVMASIAVLGTDGLSGAKALQTVQENLESLLQMDRADRAVYLKKQLSAVTVFERSAQDFGKYAQKMAGEQGFDNLGDTMARAALAGVNPYSYINAQRGSGAGAKMEAARQETQLAEAMLRRAGMSPADYKRLVRLQNEGGAGMTSRDTMELMKVQTLAQSVPGSMNLTEALGIGEKVKGLEEAQLNDARQDATTKKFFKDGVVTEEARQIISDLMGAQERQSKIDGEVARATSKIPGADEAAEKAKFVQPIIGGAMSGIGGLLGTLGGGFLLTKLLGGTLGKGAMGMGRGAVSAGRWVGGLFGLGGGAAGAAAATAAGGGAAGAAGTAAAAASAVGGTAARAGLLAGVGGAATKWGSRLLSLPVMGAVAAGDVGNRLANQWGRAKIDEMTSENMLSMDSDMAMHGDMARKFASEGQYFGHRGNKAVPFSDLNARREEILQAISGSGKHATNFGIINRAAYKSLISGGQPDMAELARQGAISDQSSESKWSSSIEQFMKHQSAMAVDPELFRIAHGPSISLDNSVDSSANDQAAVEQTSRLNRVEGILSAIQNNLARINDTIDQFSARSSEDPGAIMV